MSFGPALPRRRGPAPGSCGGAGYRAAPQPAARRDRPVAVPARRRPNRPPMALAPMPVAPTAVVWRVVTSAWLEHRRRRGRPSRHSCQPRQGTLASPGKALLKAMRRRGMVRRCLRRCRRSSGVEHTLGKGGVECSIHSGGTSALGPRACVGRGRWDVPTRTAAANLLHAAPLRLNDIKLQQKRVGRTGRAPQRSLAADAGAFAGTA